MEQNIVGKRIKQMRLEMKLKKSDFAKKINISSSAVNLYENGQRIPNDNIKKRICNFFNCSLDYLCGITDIKDSFKDKCIEDVFEIKITLKKLDIIKDNENLSREQLEYLKKLIEINAPFIKNIEK